MSNISPQGEQSTLSEINALIALTALPVNPTKAIAKTGPTTFTEINVSGTIITVSATAPSNPQVNDLWLDIS
jgi:hypothetical protein